MKFKEYAYERPNQEELVSQLKQLQEDLKEAENYERFKEEFLKLEELLSSFSSMQTISRIRHTVNTKDEFYAQENDYFDQFTPVVEMIISKIHRDILEGPYLDQLKKDLPENWFNMIEFSTLANNEEILEDVQKENSLSSEYDKLIASAQIEFDGKVYTLASLEEKMNDQDPKVRERAHKAYWGWFEENEKAIGDIFDQLVKLRHRIAQTMGYANYIPFGYIRMNRFDYDQEDVKNYRENVLRDVVPVAQKLYDSQKQRFGLTTLPAWYEKVEFEEGNPRPKHDGETMVRLAQEMYDELDPLTGEFFHFMADNELLDLESKPGKMAGGYCTMIMDEKAPFIFANFNNTQHDVEVLTHEAGHGFQCYCSKDIFPSECVWATMESAEITSMSMEFFTWPWMDKFFGEDVQKYYYSHLGGAIKFIPYGVLIDHFQHEVYAHPEWNHAQRMECFRSLEKQYLPHKDYQGIDVLERGGWWMRQLHVFGMPFYYIDYTLAQACALQFWSRMQKNDPQAFEDYKAICKTGGKLPFKKLVSVGNLEVPFIDGCLKDAIESAEEWFSQVDPAAL